MSKEPTTSEAAVSEVASTGKTPWTGNEIRLMIGAVTLIFLSSFEASATTAIMPNIVADLQADTWFSIASGSAPAASLFAVVIAGALADWRGIRVVLLGGVASFAVGLLLCAFAPHVAFFVLGRLVQGFGSGLVVVPMYMMIGSITAEPHRPTFFAAFSVAWTLPTLVGPAIAGWVAGAFGWRWVFGAVPALSVFAVFLFIPLLSVMSTDRAPFPPKLKTLGVMALIASIGVLLLQLSGALEERAPGRLILMAMLGIFLTALYLPRLLPRGLFRFKKGMPALLGSRLFALATLAGVQAFVPLVMQRVHGWPVEWAALAVTIGAIAWSVGAVIQARQTDPEWQMLFPVIGSASILIGAIGTSLLIFPMITPWIGIFFTMFVAFGVGLLHSTISALALNLAPVAKHGKVSSWLQVADTGGGALQLAIISVVMAAWATIPVVGTGYLQYLPAMLMGVFAALFALISALRAKF